MLPLFAASHFFFLLINAFVFSKLFYCSTAWSKTSKSNVKKLQLVQNFAGRIVVGLRKYDHISEGLKSLRWLPITDKPLVSVMVHRCLDGQAPDYVGKKFTSRQAHHDRKTRYIGPESTEMQDKN